MARSHIGPKSLARAMEQRAESSREHAAETTDHNDAIEERARASIYERVAEQVRRAVERDDDLGNVAESFERKAATSRDHAAETTDHNDAKRDRARAQVWDEAAAELRATIADE
jgi:hypothetical protein